MSTIYWRDDGDASYEEVDSTHPLPVKLIDPTEESVTAFEQITVATVAIGLTQSKLALGYSKIVATLETAQVRWRADGVDPSSTVGTPTDVGTVLTLTGGHDPRQIKFIRTGGTSGVLNVTYYQRAAVNG